MNLTTKNTVVTLSDITGTILSYKIKGQEFVSNGEGKRPLFTIKLLGNNGEPVYYSSSQAQEI